MTFDLTGLPPTPEEVDAFLADRAPDAYERLIDRLLASPRYGQRWGRHWLDLVRYAESDGYRQDAFRPHAWRYRDYVVRAFNTDKPYDRFLTEQLAGDELDPDDPELRVATGYLRLGTYEYNQRNVRGQWADILNDITDVTGEVFLGLSIGCARCHDHKFDPILQKDYYRLQAFFTPLLPRDDLTLATPRQWAEYQARRAAWEKAAADILRQIDALEQPYRDKGTASAIAKFPDEIKAILAKPEADRSLLERQLGALAYRQIAYEHDQVPSLLKGTAKARWDELHKALKRYDALRPVPPDAGADGDRPWAGLAADGDSGRPQARADRAGISLGARPGAGPDRAVARGAAVDRAAAGPGSLAEPARQSALDPRDRQPGLAVPFRAGPGRHVERLRPPGRAAQPSRAARLAGDRIRRERLALQAAAPADPDFGGLSPGSRAQPRATSPPASGSIPKTACSGSGPSSGSTPRRFATPCWPPAASSIRRSAARAFRPSQPRRTIDTRVDPQHPRRTPGRLRCCRRHLLDAPPQHDHDGHPGPALDQRRLGPGAGQGSGRPARTPRAIVDRRPGPDRAGLPPGLRAATRARRNRGSRWRFSIGRPSFSRSRRRDRTPRPTMRRSSISVMCS